MNILLDFISIKNIVVVGLSNKPERASFRVAKFMQERGYRIIPVNPLLEEVLGERCYPDILSLPGDLKIDVVDIFRKPEAVFEIVEQAILRDARIIWMQEGIVNEKAAQRAREACLEVVMDRCLMKEYIKEMGQDRGE